jgi:hypothetical protein
MIYETDTDLMLVWSGSAWVEVSSMLTKAPRGIVGLQTLTTSFTTSSTHTAFQNTGMTLTINEVSGRRYKITALANPYPNGGQQGVNLRIMRDATSLKQVNYAGTVMETTVAYPAVITFIYTSVSSGAATYTMQIAGSGVNTQVADYADGTFPRQFIIEDIGAA